MSKEGKTSYNEHIAFSKWHQLADFKSYLVRFWCIEVAPFVARPT